jgi:site-specific recombinase XerD
MRVSQHLAASNTLRAYGADWHDFSKWCEVQRFKSLPAMPETVALYLTDRAATLKTSSLARRLTTINRAHEAAGHPLPATMQNDSLFTVWKNILRKKGTAQQSKRPFLMPDVRRMVMELPQSPQGLRDRALLLAGFAGGLRRSELTALCVEDLEATPEGLIVRFHKSADRERAVALPNGSDPLTCPVRAITAWREQGRITAGPLFRAIDRSGFISEKPLHPDSVGYLVKRAAGRAGLETKKYSGHSLRAGLATQAAMNGASELAIMKQTGQSLAVVRKYIPKNTVFGGNAASKLGL